MNNTEIIKALRDARRFILAERKIEFESHMVRVPSDPMHGKVEDLAARRYIAKADELAGRLLRAVGEMSSRKE